MSSRHAAGVSSAGPRTLGPMRRAIALACLLLLLAGCREVRVKTYAQGTSFVLGAPQIVIVRNTRSLEELGIKAPVRFNHELGVVLLMGPHKQSGYRHVIESIRANSDRVRIVAFEKEPLEAEPSREYRTYTLWIVPNSVYRSGSHLDVVAPSGDPIATTTLQ